MGRAAGANGSGADDASGPDNPGSASSNWRDWKYTNLHDSKPLLGLSFNNENHRFGLEMLGVPDPRPAFKGANKKITYDKQGDTNNTIVFIEGSEIYFGEKNPDRTVKSENLPAGRLGNRTIEDIGDKKVSVTQHVEIVPGQSGRLDTCLIWYHVKNYGESPIRVGVRFMLDTFIGANDGVPFTAPGVKGFIKDMREFKGGKSRPIWRWSRTLTTPRIPAPSCVWG